MEDDSGISNLVEGSQKTVTTKDLVDLLQRCDQYDMGRVFKQLTDVNELLPVYFGCRKEGIQIRYLEKIVLRYLTMVVNVRTEEGLARRYIELTTNTDLPRIMFISFGSTDVNFWLL